MALFGVGMLLLAKPTSPQAALLAARQSAACGPRRLLKAHGDELVESVARVLADFGFSVDRRDERVLEGAPKLEDLRLRISEYPELGGDRRSYVDTRGETQTLTT